MAKSKKKLSQFEALINDAKDSKHTDAILLLNERKPEIQSKVIELLQKSMPESNDETTIKATEQIKKTIASFAEYVFQNCVSVLVNDKK